MESYLVEDKHKTTGEATAVAADKKVVKTLRGRVVSDGMHKTRTLVVERLIKHPIYRKYLRRSTKILFHDEQNLSHKGDEVLISPCRPFSKRKNYGLLSVLKQARK